MESSQAQPASEAEDGVVQDRNLKGQFMGKDGDDDEDAQVCVIYFSTVILRIIFQRKAKNVLHVKNSRDFKGAVNKLQGIIGMINQRVL